MRDRPDIVWIYCDELRTDALGCYGHPTLKLLTPNIDRLAAMGVRFTNNFCNSPVCVSSRTATLSGQYPEETGVYNNEAEWRHFRLPRPLSTFPQAFSKQGYRTANFGKLHVPKEMHHPADPADAIFQHHNSQGGDMGFYKEIGLDAVSLIRSTSGGMIGGVFPDDAYYEPDELVPNALRWMETAEGPSLVRLSILQPHTPVFPKARYVQMLADQDPGVPVPPLETFSAFDQRMAAVHGLDQMDPEAIRASRRHYYALTLWVDEQVGLVLDFLEQRGRLANTLIVFGADHGTPIGDTGCYGKHTFSPTSHRVPLIAAWPGTLPAGTVREDICDSLDVGRTMAAAAGVTLPPTFRGRDLFRDPAPEAIYSTIGYGERDSRMAPNGQKGDWFGGRGWPRRTCVRTARYRLDKNVRLDGAKPSPEDEDIFLADLQADPLEFTNRVADPALAATVRALSALVDAHAANSVEVDPALLARS